MGKANLLLVTPGTYIYKPAFKALAHEYGLEPLHTRDLGAVAEPERVCGIILGHEVLTAEDMGRMINLKTVARNGKGCSNIPLDQAKGRGIIVSRTAIGESLVSEYALGLILALARNIVFGHMLVSGTQLEWNSRPKGISLNEATAGIIGLGAIGSTVAERLKANGVQRLIGWNRTSRESVDQLIARTNLELLPFDDVLRQGDIVLIAVELNAETKGMISRKRLALLKPTALLINICRGELVDEEALADAVEANRISGVALDVFSQEPPYALPPFQRLRKLATEKNVILTPHLASKSKTISDKRAMQTLHNVIAALEGKLDELDIP